MGNKTSRVVGCFAPFRNEVNLDLDFLDPLDEGLGHSFCYVRPSISDSPAITPSASERFTVDSSTFDSETLSGSFRHDPGSSLPETTFKTISGASVSANVSTARTINQNFCSDVQEPAASFESTSSFSSIPLQPVPRTVNSFMSGPLERGFASGPLERGAFMSGPLEKRYFSGPLDDSLEKSSFPVKKPRWRRTFSKRLGTRWIRKLFFHPVNREPKMRLSQGDCASNRSLQWAHGKAGEDRIHVVLSEEQGWLFIGIYDGFSGPDAPDFLMFNLYKFLDKELEGVLWDYETNEIAKSELSRCGSSTKVAPFSFATNQPQKTMRLFELLQMETLGMLEFDPHPENEAPSTSGGEITRTSKSYRKQKSLRKKLFPWSYDWHREEIYGDEIPHDGAPVRKCRTGNVDHSAVLRSMARALEQTEDLYMNMVENSLDQNPELALMGSCVLVMLMKDQDVYVLNLGDSRAVLAQERPSVLKDVRNKSRELLVRKELDRISEESPVHNLTNELNMISKKREISFCRLKMRALQLSSDHSTSVDEEICRIRGEHGDDDQAIVNDRVKGQLKVTRAFGAAFLKKPACNDALLEMFQINFVGNSPYLSCTPSALHHRLTSGDRFLVLSSDGLYQYFSNEEVVAHVTWFMENVPEGDPAQYLIAELLLRAAKKNGMDFHELLDIPHGDRRKYHDDVSVMVVSFEGRIWKSSG